MISACDKPIRFTRQFGGRRFSNLENQRNTLTKNSEMLTIDVLK